MANVVWFKRDLRVTDHRPLAEASARGPVIALYIYEPEIVAQAETDPSHYVFIDACLAELDAELHARGIDALYSHEETGGDVSYRRDRRVAAWCRARGIVRTEIPQFGVVRRLRSRNGWARAWERRMNEPIVDARTSNTGADTAVVRLRSVESP